jgi:hypothetical protein
MNQSTRKALVVLPALLLALPAAAIAVPAEVQVRIEGRTQTLFEGPVTTDGHNISTTTSPAPHKCDGTNAGAQPAPGPTSGAALDDAVRLAGLTWDGEWFDDFQDFQILRVGPDGIDEPNGQFWGQFLNYGFSIAGGCQERVMTGDESTWVFDAFSKAKMLRMTGQDTATTGQSIEVRVVNTLVDPGDPPEPIAGATVAGAVTDVDGRATLTFSEEGIYNLKAERADAVRSNGIRLCVDPPGAERCTSGDDAAPTITADAPEYATATRSGRFDVSWQAGDGAGSGVAAYDLDVRRLDVPNSPWNGLARNTSEVSWRFGGIPGAAYEFRVVARDRAANASQPATAGTVVPFDNLDTALRYGRGWNLVRRPNAYKGSVLRTKRRGARARLRFRGTRMVLIGRRLPRGGRMRLRVDGVRRTLRLRGRGRHRRVLFGTVGLDPGAHTLTLTSLGGGPVELDAVAAIP